MDIEARANKVAEYANTCCYRSDGFDESVLNIAREAITEAVAAEREACAKKAERMANGKAIAAALRMRSNGKVKGAGVI